MLSGQLLRSPAEVVGAIDEGSSVMTTKDDWTNLSERLDALALKLKLHLEQSGATDGAPQALGDLRERVEGAFAAAGNALNDEAVRADLREVGRLLADAMSTSFAKVSDDVRDAWERRH
jgi:hypothetical protein